MAHVRDDVALQLRRTGGYRPSRQDPPRCGGLITDAGTGPQTKLRLDAITNLRIPRRNAGAGNLRAAADVRRPPV